jgi:hypothetical protein
MNRFKSIAGSLYPVPLRLAHEYSKKILHYLKSFFRLKTFFNYSVPLTKMEGAMARPSKPYYSKEGSVYHIFSDCSAGRTIKKRLKVSGKGNRKLCGACKGIKAGKRKR